MFVVLQGYEGHVASYPHKDLLISFINMKIYCIYLSRRSGDMEAPF